MGCTGANGSVHTMRLRQYHQLAVAIRKKSCMFGLKTIKKAPHPVLTAINKLYEFHLFAGDSFWIAKFSVLVVDP